MECIAAMQRVRLFVARIEIIKHEIMIYDVLQRRTRSSQLTQLTSGWYLRFLSRHPVLVPRSTQIIGRVRNAACKSSVDVLFNKMDKLLIEIKIDSSRVFNMDETSFTSKL